MGVGPFTHVELSLAGRVRPQTGSRAIALAALCIVAHYSAIAFADVPSKIIIGVRSTCMETCQEKENAADCSLYCNCHIFELRRDITDSQLEQMLLTAERGGTGAPKIREWLVASAKVCEKRVFGDPPAEKKSE